MAIRHPLARARSAALAASLLASLSFTPPSSAAIVWQWQYANADLSAEGTLTTEDTPDAAGFYTVVGITGTRGGEAIVGLQPTGTWIPGNEPFAVDNLVQADGTLTHAGFGYATAGGTYANVFLADWLSPAVPMEFSSVPAQGLTHEAEVVFNLARLPGDLPEPPMWALLGAGVLAWAASRRRRPWGMGY